MANGGQKDLAAQIMNWVQIVKPLQDKITEFMQAGYSLRDNVQEKVGKIVALLTDASSYIATYQGVNLVLNKATPDKSAGSKAAMRREWGTVCNKFAYGRPMEDITAWVDVHIPNLEGGRKRAAA